jgi:hypothetical protein
MALRKRSRLLLAGPRPQNLLLQSENFDTTWANTMSVEEGGFAGPGGMNAWKITDDGLGGTGSVAISQGSAAGFITSPLALYCSAARLKADQLSWVRLSQSGNAAQTISAYFDLANGVIGATLGANNLTQDMVSLGDGWWLCWVGWQADATDLQTTFNIFAADGNNDSTVDRDGTSSFFVTGGQINTGLKPKPYRRTLAIAAP